MAHHSNRLAFFALALTVSGIASAMPTNDPAETDLCVVYPYCGQTSTPVPGWVGAPDLSDVDPCVIYPYDGETSTPVPGWSPDTGPTAAARPASRAVIDEWGVVETAEDLERVLAGFGRGQYQGL